MPTWKAYFQINGYDYSRYPDYEFIASELKRLAGEEDA